FLEHFVGQIAPRAARRGVPIAVLGAGYGPINTAAGHGLLGWLAEHAPVLAVREEEAAVALRSVGGEHAVVVADPVLLEPPPALTSRAPDPERAGVSLRPFAGLERSAAVVGSAVAALRARKRPVGLPFDLAQDPP